MPVAAAGWAGAWLGTGLTGPDRWSLVAVACVLATVATLCLIAHRWRVVVAGAAALGLVGTVAVGALAAQRVTNGPVAELAGVRAVVMADAVVRSDPQVRTGQFGGYATVRVRLETVSGRGQAWAVRAPVLLIVGGDPAVESWRRVLVGSTVRVSGRLETVERGSDVAAVLRLRQGADVRAPPGPSLLLVERVRDGLRSAVAGRPAEPRALVPALVLGDTSAMTDDLQQSFQATGLTHLTAVSGANLTLLLAFLLFGAKWLGVRGRWLRVVGLGGVVVFVALCRTEPSVCGRRRWAWWRWLRSVPGAGARVCASWLRPCCCWCSWIPFSPGRSASPCRCWPAAASSGGPRPGSLRRPGCRARWPRRWRCRSRPTWRRCRWWRRCRVR